MSMDPSGALGGAHSHVKLWLIGIGAAVVLYLLLRSPGNGSGGGGTLYTTGVSSDQAVSLAEAGMQLQLGVTQINAQKDVSLAGISAAKNVANNQTAAATKQTSILASLEEMLGKLQLQGLENTNSTQLSAVKSNNATAITLGNIASTTAENLNNPSLASKLNTLISTTLNAAGSGFKTFWSF